MQKVASNSFDTTNVILIVDDHTPTRNALAYLLRKSGYRAVCVPDGLSALAFLQNVRPRLMILDLIMPGIDGVAVLRSVRANPDRADLPVIVCTASNDAQSLAEISRLGVQALIKKADWQEVIRCVKFHAERALAASCLISG
jgi:CheY-like chemotaxis protein